MTTKKTLLWPAGIVAAVALGLAGMTACGGSEAGESTMARHFHAAARYVHGGVRPDDTMARMIEELRLSPTQQARLDRLHESMGQYMEEAHEPMEDLHVHLATQLEKRSLDASELKRVVDAHEARMRELGHAVADEMVALAGELDERQREVVVAHLRQHHPETPEDDH
jgi:hypothetical protein